MKRLQRGGAKHRVALICRAKDAWKVEGLKRSLSQTCQVEIVPSTPSLASRVDWLAAHDLVFFKGKDDRFLDLMAQVERLGHAQVINRTEAVVASKNRMRSLALAREAGVPVPDDFAGALCDVPFSEFVIKNPTDDDQTVPIVIRSSQQRQDEIAKRSPQAMVYVQRFIQSVWEYKIYSVGGELFGFRQRPILINPNKLETRTPYDVPPSMRDLARRTIDAVGLEVGGVDLLGTPESPYVTDINSTQGLHNFEEGYRALVRYFDRCLQGHNLRTLGEAK